MSSPEFFIVLVEGYEEPMPMRGPYPSYDDAVEAHYQAALNDWPKEESSSLLKISPHDFYLTDDAVRIGRFDR